MSNLLARTKCIIPDICKSLKLTIVVFWHCIVIYFNLITRMLIAGVFIMIFVITQAVKKFSISTCQILKSAQTQLHLQDFDDFERLIPTFLFIKDVKVTSDHHNHLNLADANSCMDFRV